MQDAPKAVWSIPYVSVALFFPSLKQNFIAYRSSKVSSRPDCLKLNTITWKEFEFTSYDPIVQYVSHNAPRTTGELCTV